MSTPTTENSTATPEPPAVGVPPPAPGSVLSLSTLEYREAVAAFGEVMVAKLEENAHKGRRIAWQNWRPDCMAGRMSEELRELAEAIESGNAAEAMREAADVANFALMVWDWYACRQLPPNIKMSNAGALALAPCSALPETASVMVLEYEPRLTHSRWIDFYGEDHWSMEDTVAYLRQAVIDGKYVGWRILTIHKEVIGNDRPNNDSADMWTYSKYRASLRRNGHPFAIVTPDGKNALNENDIEIILAALNGNPPNNRDVGRAESAPTQALNPPK